MIEYFPVTPVVTAGAYSINDVVGGRLRFAGVGSGTLVAVTLADNAAQAVDYRLVLFHSTPTDIADNATFDVADADIRKIIWDTALLTASERFPFTDNSFHRRYLTRDAQVGLRSKEGDGSLWGFLIATTAPTYAATSDVTVTLHVDQHRPVRRRVA